MLRQLFEVLILPPASALLLLLIGCALRRWRPRIGRLLQLASVAWIWLASTPCFGGLLLCTLQSAPALPTEGRLPRADAIVVLAAGADRVGGEYGGPVIGPITMQRLRYAAALHRRTGLPLLCSGGAPASGAPSLAAMMKQTAEKELGVRVRWTEERSANTLENLRFSAQLHVEIQRAVAEGVAKHGEAGLSRHPIFDDECWLSTALQMRRNEWRARWLR